MRPRKNTVVGGKLLISDLLEASVALSLIVIFSGFMYVQLVCAFFEFPKIYIAPGDYISIGVSKMYLWHLIFTYSMLSYLLNIWDQNDDEIRESARYSAVVGIAASLFVTILLSIYTYMTDDTVSIRVILLNQMPSFGTLIVFIAVYIGSYFAPIKKNGVNLFVLMAVSSVLNVSFSVINVYDKIYIKGSYVTDAKGIKYEIDDRNINNMEWVSVLETSDYLYFVRKNTGEVIIIRRSDVKSVRVMESWVDLF